MKLTYREKHILQALVMLVICGAVIMCSIANDRIIRIKAESEMWHEMYVEWRENTWYWQDAYFDLLYETEYQLNELDNTRYSEEESTADMSWNDIGECRITFYCPCEKCNGKWAGQTAIGAIPQEGRTVAVDRSVIPLGSEVLIDGYIYIAEDTGVRGKAVDIFLNDHQRCYDNGTYMANVKWRPANINT